MRARAWATGSSGHVERCAVLLHLVDGAAGDVVRAWRTVREELAAYGGGLADKPELIGLNKVDAMTAARGGGAEGGAGEGIRAAGDAAVRRHRPGRAGGAARAAGDDQRRPGGRRRRERSGDSESSPPPLAGGRWGRGRPAFGPLPPPPQGEGEAIA